MISKEEAQNKVYEAVCKGWRNDEFPEDKLIIIESETIDKEEFWVFFYTSKLWYETEDMQYANAYDKTKEDIDDFVDGFMAYLK